MPARRPARLRPRLSTPFLEKTHAQDHPHPLLASLLASPAFEHSLVGEWIATAHSPEGNFLEKLSVKKLGESYSIGAELITPLPGTLEAGPAMQIVIQGDTFSFTRSVGDTIKIVYSGRVSGDEFDGMVDIAGFQIPYSGVRAKDD